MADLWLNLAMKAIGEVVRSIPTEGDEDPQPDEGLCPCQGQGERPHHSVPSQDGGKDSRFEHQCLKTYKG